MNFNLTEEQEMLRDSARRVLRETYEFEHRRRSLKDIRPFINGNWAQFAELGWLALPLPEEAGGLGCDFVDSTLLGMELGRRLVIEPFVSTAILAARVIDASGNEELRQSLLPAIAEGALRIAVATVERDSGYDAAAITTSAIRDGSGFVLNGAKLSVVDAPVADRLLVSAVIKGGDHDGGIGLFLIDRDQSGVALTAYPLIDGTPAGDLRLVNVAVAGSALLVAGDRALDVLDEATDRASLVQVAMAVGAMEAVMDMTAEYIKTRRQFGQAIGKFQSLQHRMAEMLTRVEDTRSLLYRALAHLDGSAAGRRKAVSAARVVAAEAGNLVGGQGIQLHGGIGLTDECAVGHYFKRLIVLEKTLGDSDWHMARYMAQ